MNEAEAKTKWCPFRSNDMLTTILEGEIPNTSYCIGSQCMAWRWILTPDDAKEADGIGRMGDGIPTGLCGLAGKQ